MRIIGSRKAALYLCASLITIPLYVFFHAYTRLAGKAESRPKIGDTLPSFPVQKLDGTTVPFDALTRGKRTAVIFVKAECPNCKRMLALYEKQRDVQIVAVAENPLDELPALQQKAPKAIIVRDADRAFYKDLGGLLVPLTFLLDERGRVVAVIDGVKTETTVAASFAGLR